MRTPLARVMGVRSVGDGNAPNSKLCLHLAARLLMRSGYGDWYLFARWLDTAHGYNYQLFPELASFLAATCKTIDALEHKLQALRHYTLTEQIQLLSILETYYAPETSATESLLVDNSPCLPEEV